MSERYGDLLKELFYGIKNSSLSDERMEDIRRAFNEMWDRENRYQQTDEGFINALHIGRLLTDKIAGFTYLYLEDTAIPNGTIGQNATLSDTIVPGEFVADGQNISYARRGRVALLFGNLIIASGAVNCKMTLDIDSSTALEEVFDVPCNTNNTDIPFVHVLDNTRASYDTFQINVVHGAATAKDSEMYVGLLHIL